GYTRGVGSLHMSVSMQAVSMHVYVREYAGTCVVTSKRIDLVCACVRACVCACMHECLFVRVCVCMFACVPWHKTGWRETPWVRSLFTSPRPSTTNLANKGGMH